MGAAFKSMSPDCQKQTRTYGTNTWWSDNLPAMAIYCRQQFDENVSIKRVRKPEQPFQRIVWSPSCNT